MVLLLFYTALRIGFQLPIYNFTEPNIPTPFNVTLVKEGNRQTEQTFGIIIRFGDPSRGISPASLQLEENLAASSDYLVNVPGNNVINCSFGPDENSVTIAFTLLPDDFIEGIEGFRGCIESQGFPFPKFQLPISTSTDPAYADTLIRIQDNDCMFVYNVTETT